MTRGKWHVECLVLMEMEKGQKKEAVLVRVIALLEGEEGFTQLIERRSGKQATLRSSRNSNKPLFTTQLCFSASVGLCLY